MAVMQFSIPMKIAIENVSPAGTGVISYGCGCNFIRVDTDPCTSQRHSLGMCNKCSRQRHAHHAILNLVRPPELTHEVLHVCQLHSIGV